MSIAEAQRILLADFDALPDWGERYRYIIALGAQLPPMPEALITPANRVLSCASATYFFVGANNGALAIHAHSNAPIPLGLAALLHRIYDGAPLREAAQEPLLFPEKSGLLKSLSGPRLLGFQEMICRINTSLATR
jgi:cysteine desulfuration protein SufE